MIRSQEVTNRSHWQAVLPRTENTNSRVHSRHGILGREHPRSKRKPPLRESCRGKRSPADQAWSHRPLLITDRSLDPASLLRRAYMQSAQGRMHIAHAHIQIAKSFNKLFIKRGKPCIRMTYIHMYNTNPCDMCMHISKTNDYKPRRRKHVCMVICSHAMKLVGILAGTSGSIRLKEKKVLVKCSHATIKVWSGVAPFQR
jgi:hypothetical protein